MNSSLIRAAFVLLLAGSAVIVGCAEGDGGAESGADTTMTDTTDALVMAEERAVVELTPTEGNTAVGTVTFTSENGSVRAEAMISGLAPGPHGIHIHEIGDCSAPDASSAGEHFNPEGDPHGGPDDEERHVGDLGNIEADQDSTAQLDLDDERLAMSGPNSIIGKALVVHAGEDDQTTQPSGDSGSRVACGVIEMESGMPGMGSGAAQDTAAVY